MIGRVIKHILENDTDITSMTSTRIYPDVRPQDVTTTPAIVYRVLGKTREHSQEAANVDMYRVEFMLYADTYYKISEMERRLEDAIDRYPIGTVIQNWIVDGTQQEIAEDDPYDVDEDGLRNKTANYYLRIKAYTLVMDYSTSEQSTGVSDENGNLIYAKTWNWATPTTTVSLTGMDTLNHYLIDGEFVHDRRTAGTPSMQVGHEISLLWSGSVWQWTHGLGTSYPLRVTLFYTK